MQTGTRQYDLRRDACGWTVFERRTGRSVMLSGAEQRGMSWIEAEDLVERLGRRRGRRRRPVSPCDGRRRGLGARRARP